jgi:long-chain fatty acid transport protein
MVIISPILALAGGLYIPGVGVRSSAMGGAFVGMADDYSAVHWNPAGISQIRGFEVTVTGHDGISLASRAEGMMRFDGAEIGWLRPVVIEATSDATHYFAPGVYLYMDTGPLSAVSDKFGICAYTLADFGAIWDGEKLYDDFIDTYTTLPGDPNGYRQIFGDPPDFESRITGYVVSPVLAKRLTDNISVGVSAHAVYGSFHLLDGGWYEESFEDSSHLFSFQSKEDLTGWGYGATIGMLYDVDSQISIGVAVRTPVTVSLDGDIEFSSVLDTLALGKHGEEMEFTFPMWAGVGLAYRGFLFDNLTMTADIHWTQWSEVSEFTRVMATEIPEDLEILVPLTTLNWDDTIGFHLGFETKLSQAAALRFGYASVPETVASEDYSFVLPQGGHNIVSLGFGYRQDRWNADVTLAYMMGTTMTKAAMAGAVGDSSQGKNLHDEMVPSLSLTYLF